MLYIVSFVFYKFMGACAKYELVLFPPFHQSKREVELKQSAFSLPSSSSMLKINVTPYYKSKREDKKRIGPQFKTF